MKAHHLKHSQERRRERDNWWLLTANNIKQFNENSRTKGQTCSRIKNGCGGYSQPNTLNNPMKTHPLKRKHDRRKKRYTYGGYSQPNTLNNSMKTHCLKHRHDKRRENRCVVVTHSLIHQKSH